MERVLLPEYQLKIYKIKSPVQTNQIKVTQFLEKEEKVVLLGTF